MVYCGFQTSKCRNTNSQPQIWSIWPIFPNDSESLPKVCYIKRKNSEILSKCRNSESAEGSDLNICGISLLDPPWEDNRGYSLLVQDFHHCQGFLFVCDGLAWSERSLMFAPNAAPVSNSASNWLGMATSARGRIVSWYTGSNSLRNELFLSSSDFAKVWMDVNSLWNVKARAGVAHHWVTHVYKAWVYLHINVHNSCHEIIRTNSTSFNFLTTSPSLMRKLLLPM